jgi:DNA-binding winged helix-turn-helix (wHTH) protein
VRVRFPPFTLDSDTRQLSRSNCPQPDVHLSPKAFDLLCLLIEQRPKVLEKRVLHARIWPDTFVGDATLNVLVGEIRKAIDDDVRQPRFIRTVHGVGYAFCGQVADEAAPGADGTLRLRRTASADKLLCWLTWRGTTFRLDEGDNVIGRGPRCAVFLDVDGVSRRHANIHIDAERRDVTVADLGSTNGTFIGRTRVTSPMVLQDDDRITVGSVELRVRLWASEDGPKTRRIRRRRRDS